MIVVLIALYPPVLIQVSSVLNLFKIKNKSNFGRSEVNQLKSILMKDHLNGHLDIQPVCLSVAIGIRRCLSEREGEGRTSP